MAWFFSYMFFWFVNQGNAGFIEFDDVLSLSVFVESFEKHWC